ncbi:hypothetical protein [Hyphomicrobium sp. DY-1]|uniref:hypothetical protein n=1 Tax=Hyphomicrobium sp. DY-1 TaxID=3075650 RepID=UPI0039C245B4
MHNIVLDRDNIGRLTVVQASSSTMLTDPLENMHSRARRDILLKPLSSAERQLMRAAKHLDIQQRRVVTHYILTNRRADYEHHQSYLEREATRLRRQNAIDTDNKRQAAHLQALAHHAEKQATPTPAPGTHDPDDQHEDEEEMGR